MATSCRRRLADIYELTTGKHRIPPMEGLRGLAVLLVFFVHYDSLFSHYAPSTSITSALSHFAGLIGNSGVDLFFVLSGYLIYGMALRAPCRYGKFIARRAIRIYPAYLAVLVLYLILSGVLPDKSKLPVDTGSMMLYLLQNVVFLPGLFDIRPIITVAWSLSYEVFYYLTVPLLVVVTQLPRWPRWSRVSLFSVLTIAFLVHGWIAPHPHLRLVMFLAGILVYEALSSRASRSNISRLGEVLAVTLALVSFAAVYLSRQHPGLHSAYDTAGARSLLWVVAFGATYFSITLYAFGQTSWLARFLSGAPIRWLGNMSYSYYLIHGLALNGVAFIAYRAHVPAGTSATVFWIILPLAFLATLLLSTLLFVVVEKPLSLRTRFSRQRLVSATASIQLTPSMPSVSAGGTPEPLAALLERQPSGR